MDIFKIIEAPRDEESNESGCLIGLDISIAGRGIFFPLTRLCQSPDDLALEIQSLKGYLDELLEEAKPVFERGSLEKSGIAITDDMDCAQAWKLLSEIEDEDSFVLLFNGIDEEKRKEIADYILTQCNVFSENGQIFSRRYETGRNVME